MALKVAVLISGRGSNLESLARACAEPDSRSEIVLVLSNNPQAPGLELARQRGLKTEAIDHRAFTDRENFDQALHAALTAAEVELICLAGFMRLLTPEFVDSWRDRIINIHPSLLPAFKGLDVHRRAVEAGVRFTGATVHYVRPDMDDGPIVAQAAVPVLPDDTPDRLAARVLAAEHRIYPQALRLIAHGRARVENDRVVINNADWPHMAALAPLPTE